MSARPPLLLAGGASAELGRAVAGALGVALGELAIERFPDGEPYVELREPARGRSVYVVQSAGAPVGEALLELLLIADACRRGDARRVVAIVPYLGLARQDRRRREGEPLGVRVAADLLAAGRFARVVTVDLHAPATEGCFGAPLDHVSAIERLAEAARRAADRDAVVIAPDAGAVRMARAYARMLGAPIAIVEKIRRGADEVEALEIVGSVAGKRPILVDDIVSTGGTIAAALRAALARGAAPGALVVTSHLMPAAGAASRLTELPIERVIATDSLPPPRAWSIPLERVSLAPLLAEVIGRMERGEPLGALVSAR